MSEQYDIEHEALLVELKNPCPLCGSALRLREKKKTQKEFLGCSKFPKCRYTFFLFSDLFDGYSEEHYTKDSK
mgnify:CR=1 FL=1